METITRTAQVIADQLTEPTGAHFLDSGGAYGRNWQRNQGMTVEDWQAGPAATIDRYGTITLSVFHYLSRSLTYCPALDAGLGKYAEVTEGPWLDIAEQYAQTLKGEDNLGGYPASSFTWNTYNGESALSQVIQGVTFHIDDMTAERLGIEDGYYALVQIHGGCDVRGGYGRPRAYRIDADQGDCWPYGHASALVFCVECDWRDYVEDTWHLAESGLTVNDLAGEEHATCPECGHQIKAEPSYF